MAKFREIEFNDRSFFDYGFYLKKGTPYIDYPELSYDVEEVEGAANGAELTGSLTAQNIDRTYTFKSIPTKIPHKNESKFLKVFTDFLMTSRDGYKKLKDSTRRGYFCYAFLKSVSSLTKSFDGCFEISVTFSCRPYWYREFEPIQKTMTTSTSRVIKLYNPEVYTAYPYIKVELQEEQATENNGLYINDGTNTFEVFDIDGYIEIDSEKKNAYKGNLPKNSSTNLKDYPNFPKLKSGENVLTFTLKSSGTYTITVVPKWRCL